MNISLRIFNIFQEIGILLAPSGGLEAGGGKAWWKNRGTVQESDDPSPSSDHPHPLLFPP